MTRRPALALALLLLPGAVLAETLPPPLPPPETFAADISYAVASVLLIAALAAAGWLAGRR